MNEYVKDLNRIEFIITNACTGRCKHCSQGDHINSMQSVRCADAQRAVEDIAGQYNITSLMTFGGEPLLFSDTVCAVHKTASRIGISKRQLITNGFFSKDGNVIKAVAKNVVESGINDILLSVDAFHQETIPLEYVKRFAEALKSNGGAVRLQPAWLVSIDDENPYNIETKKVLEEFSYLNIPVGQGNVIFPEGNALLYLKEYFSDGKEYKNPYDEDVMHLTSVSIEPDGTMLGKSIYTQSAVEILDSYTPFE